MIVKIKDMYAHASKRNEFNVSFCIQDINNQQNHFPFSSIFIKLSYDALMLQNEIEIWLLFLQVDCFALNK